MANKPNHVKIVVFGEDVTNKVKSLRINPCLDAFSDVSIRKNHPKNIVIEFKDGSKHEYSSYEAKVTINL